MELWIKLIFFVILFFGIVQSRIHHQIYRVLPPNDIVPTNDNVKKFPPSSIKENELVDNTLAGTKNLGYYITVGFGSPPQKINLIIDTGSSNTAVAGVDVISGKQGFDSSKSSTFKDTGIPVAIKYDSGDWQGQIVNDNLTLYGLYYSDFSSGKLSSRPVNFNARFSLISKSYGFFQPMTNWQGILGLAYPLLSQPSNLMPRVTVLDQLIQTYKLRNMFSIALCGYPNGVVTNDIGGHFIIGGGDPKLYVGPLVEISIYRQWFYDIIISGIHVGNKPVLLSNCKEYNRQKTIVDTGTTLTMFPKLVFHALITVLKHNMRSNSFLLPSSNFWDGTAIICVKQGTTIVNRTLAWYFPEVDFDLVINDTAAVRLALSPQNYLTLVLRRSDLFGNIQDCFKLGFGQSSSGTILGDTFMEGFYFAFDRLNNKIGIAQSTCNSYLVENSTNVKPSRIIKVMTDLTGLNSCASSNLQVISLFDYVTSSLSIILCVLFATILVPTIVLLLWCQCRNNRAQTEQASSPIFTEQSQYNTIK